MHGTLATLMADLRVGLRAAYGLRLRGLLLFGSYARGEAGAESDVDVLVVLDDIPAYGAEVDRTSELVSRVSLAYAVSISIVFVRESEWRTGDSPFLRNVREEAIAA